MSFETTVNPNETHLHMPDSRSQRTDPHRRGDTERIAHRHDGDCVYCETLVKWHSRDCCCFSCSAVALRLLFLIELAFLTVVCVAPMFPYCKSVCEQSADPQKRCSEFLSRNYFLFFFLTLSREPGFALLLLLIRSKRVFITRNWFTSNKN